jgi:hypothetical protein
MGWAVNATPRSLYSRERPGTRCIGGWLGPIVSLDGCGKSRPHRDSSPEPSNPSELAIQLSYPGPKLYSTLVIL